VTAAGMLGAGPAAGTVPLAARLPRLCRDLAVLKDKSTMLIEGTPSRHRLTGRAAVTVLPRLLTLLDGQHSLVALGAELGLPAGQVEQALALLDHRGLVEWVSPDAPAGLADEHAASYFSRNLSVIGGYRSTEDLTAALAASCVLLVAPDLLADQIAADLTEAGVGQVRVCSRASAATEVPVAGPAGRALVAVYQRPGDERGLSGALAVGNARGVPVLRFSGGAGFAEVGPLFYDNYTACAPCFQRGYRTRQWAGGTAANVGQAPRLRRRLAVGVLAGLVGAEALAVLAHVTAHTPIRRMARITLPGYHTECYEVLPEPGCPRCGRPASLSGDASVAWDYEVSVSHLPAALDWTDIRPQAETERLAELQWQRDQLPWAPVRALPAPPDIPALDVAAGEKPSPRPTARPDAEALVAGLLAWTAGFRDQGGQPGSRARQPGARAGRRWAPSGGNLASAEIYLVTDASRFGWPGTIVKYQDVEHQVAAVQADSIPPARVLAETDMHDGGLDLILIMVGNVGRLRQKYGDFCWRLAHLDAGCAALQLTTVAADYGLTLRFATTWTPALAGLLELDPEREVITAVAGLTLGGPARRAGRPECPC
jgi:bacteriocin biosynthesis cyclodehydratase domain-containing protein